MDKAPRTQFRKTRSFQYVYKIGIAIKGFDGFVELLAGLALLFSPSLVHTILGSIAGEANEQQGQLFQSIADSITRVNADFAKNSVLFLVIFLISHGVIKLALVYALLKEITKAYPYALIVLILFLIYQLYVLAINPTIGMALFALLDAIIIWLVWGEYKDLREKTIEK
jgi:uncharacterized membrane protein